MPLPPAVRASFRSCLLIRAFILLCVATVLIAKAFAIS